MAVSLRRTALAVCSIAAMLGLTACAGSSGVAPTHSSLSTIASGYPVSIDNCGRTLTFESAPARVVSLWQAPTEMMLALGLRDRITAIAGNYSDFPESVAAQAAHIPYIGQSMSWPSKEVLLSQGADLVVGQSLKGYAFDTAQGYASVDELEQGGAQVYGASMCDADGGDARKMTLETPIHTLRDFGTIFGVSDRSDEIIAQMEAQRQKVVDAVKGKRPERVAFYNGGEGPMIVLAGGIYDSAITTAGGKDVFAADSTYVSKEDFAASAPDVILVGTFQGQDFGTQRAFLEKTFPELAAVRGGRIAEIPVDDTDASIAVMRGLTQIANALHPGLDLAVPAS